MAQYALDRVLSVAGTDAVTNNILFYADQIVDPSLSFTSETEDIVDALNNVVMVMENGRGATFGASNAFFNTQILAAQVGGIGIAPGANINYVTGHAIFEATHGTAPKYAGLDKVNPSSVILSGVLMLEHLGWSEAAKLITQSMEKTIESKVVTYDFARLMDGATEVKCSEFADELIKNME